MYRTVNTKLYKVLRLAEYYNFPQIIENTFQDAAFFVASPDSEL